MWRQRLIMESTGEKLPNIQYHSLNVFLNLNFYLRIFSIIVATIML